MTADFYGNRILGEQLLQLVDRYPGTMVEHITDITEFVQITNNMRGRQNLYGNLVSVLFTKLLFLILVEVFDEVGVRSATYFSL